mmetsp:Transcript_3268/g.7641  ORF Transcript_3268/g.7641 Transcript_3268/m.7641 type:complete len:287 (+) Transcript_3268:181-1041(+)
MDKNLRALFIITVALTILGTISYGVGLGYYATLALGLQILVFMVHGLPNMSEKFYDASGSLTHLALILVSFVNDTHRHPRQIMCSVFGIIWLTRLGSFLFQRILRDGKDTRFDKMKANGLTFFSPWVIQALWVFLIQLPILILNSEHVPGSTITILDIIGWTLWFFGFFFEVIADSQKFAFRNKASNHDKFITTGLWAYSQHPNYFGEILMWSAICISATSSFTTVTHFLGWISPAFTYFLLLKVSGVPMLKKKADKKWKGQKAYDYYVENTPEIIPKLNPTIYEG